MWLCGWNWINSIFPLTGRSWWRLCCLVQFMWVSDWESMSSLTSLPQTAWPCHMAVTSSQRLCIAVLVLPENIERFSTWRWLRATSTPFNDVWKMSWACDIAAEMLLILKKLFGTWLFEAKSWIRPSKGMSHDFEWGQYVAETKEPFYIPFWNLFRTLRLTLRILSQCRNMPNLRSVGTTNNTMSL